MNIHILLLFLVTVFAISTKWYISICRQTLFVDNKLIQDAFFPLYTFNAIGTIIFLLTSPQTDTINDFRWYFLISPCLLPLLVFLAQAYFTKQKKWGITYLVCLICVFLLPKDFLLFGNFMPFIADRFILSLILYSYTNNYNLLNTLKGTSATQMLVISLGGFALYLYGAVPQTIGYIGLIHACVLVPFLAFSLNTTCLHFTPYGCNTLGFIYGWFSLWIAAEGMVESSIILNSWFIYELLLAYGRRLTFMDRYKKIEYNTFLYSLKIQGYTPAFVMRSYIKVLAFILLFACLQTTSPSNTSFLIFSFFILVWSNYKILNPSSGKKTLKETNAEFINSLKEEYSNFKKQITPVETKKKTETNTAKSTAKKKKTAAKKTVSTKSKKRK